MTSFSTPENGALVRLFGGPHVALNDEQVRLSPRQAALVCLVFGHPAGTLSRTRAIWLLWERDPGSRERHALRQLLHVTLDRIGDRIIETHGDRLRASPRATLDVEELELHLEEGRINDAARLAAAGFAAALPTTIGRELDDWVYGRRLGLEQRVIEAAATVWHDREARGWERASDAAEALYRLRPLDPRHVRMVIEARARAGRLAAAEAAYAAHTLVIGEDPPTDDDLESLMDRVRSLDQSGLVPSERRPRTVPLIGRDRELTEACKLLHRPDHPGCEVLVVRGEAGIGKSRLLEEVCKEGALRGYRCMTARPVELERNIALNPIIDALSTVDVRPHLDALGEPWKAIIASVLPASATDGPPGEVPPIQESSLSRRLLDAFWMLFDRMASEAPLLLVIDDIQWADPSSIALLQFLERRWDSGRLVLAYAARPDRLARLGALEKYLRREGQDAGTEITLRELEDPAATELLRSAVGTPMDQRVESYISSLAANHPFYIIELARDHEAGRLRPPPQHGDTVPIPVSLQQLFDTRLERFSDGALRVAALLAVRAKPMRIVEIAALVDIEVEPCADRLEELQRHHFVEVSRDRATVSHELFRNALYRHLGEARRAVLHRRIAEHLEASESPDVSGELAVHYARAGDNPRAVRFAKEAAADARKNGALASAAKYFEIVAENTDDDHERAIATGDLAATLHLDRQIDRAGPMLELAATRLRDVDEAALARRMEIRRIESMAEMGALPVDGLLEGVGEIKDECVEAADAEALALALEAEVQIHRRIGNFEGLDQTFKALHRAAASAHTAACCSAHISLGLEILYGRPQRGLRSALRAERLTRSVGLAGYRFRALQRLHSVLLTLGMLELPRSERYTHEARQLAERSGDLWLRSALKSNLGVAALDAGHLDRAESLLMGAFQEMGHADLSRTRFNQQVSLGELYVEKGEWCAARGAFEQATQHSSQVTRADEYSMVEAGLGLCALADGRLSEARLREQAIVIPKSNWDFDPYLIVAFKARLLLTRGKAQEALYWVEREADRVEGRLVLAWLKLRLLEARLARRSNRPMDRRRLTEALRRAESLRQETRATQLRAMMTLAMS